MLWLYTELTPSENKQEEICFTLYVQGSSLASCVSERETPPESQGDAERKQQTFSLEPSTHRSQGAAGVPTDSGGMWIAPTFIPFAVPAQEDCRGHRGQMAEKKWSSRARGGFPHRFRDTSMLSRRLTEEWKPTDVKVGRLGMVTIKVSVAWKSSS